jgi:NAD(P)-dependent dehydrogenase (short-subunit alcohol dehydrogenase family)
VRSTDGTQTHTMPADLSGKVALVTGGTRGLGREMVFGLARAGADVVVVSRRQDACDAVAHEVAVATGQRAIGIAAHVGRWADVDALVESAFREFGHIDVLVNNAGIAPLYPSLGKVSEELFDKVIAVNLKGPFRLGALVGERMQAGRGGSIINISSIGSRIPTPADLPYAAAKSGLNTLTRGFALSFGPTVRCNAVLVGPFLTDISRTWDVSGFQAYAAEHFPLGRLGHPREIVGTIVYLASNDSSFTTGSLLTVDGGLSVTPPVPEGAHGAAAASEVRL